MSQLVAVVADSAVMPFELSLATRVLGSVRDARGRPGYTVRHCSERAGPLATAAGFSITLEHDLSLLRRADLVVVAPSPQHTSLKKMAADTMPPIVRALKECRASRIASVCLGSFLLAAAGRLDGRTATTHWAAADLLARSFPAITVDPDALFVTSAEITTSAGAAAGIDMLLHVVREDHGSAIATDTARTCVVPAWRDGGQRQFIKQPVPQHPEDHLGDTMDWALERLDEPLTVDQLAAHARMSRRTFTRKFRAATGTTATTWIIRQRLELARNLLETTDRTIDDIAHTSGMGSASSLRNHLRRNLGVSPASYRTTFHTPDPPEPSTMS
ncbi:GlxA family transcriptional regulator [Naumannella huperziae]